MITANRLLAAVLMTVAATVAMAEGINARSVKQDMGQTAAELQRYSVEQRDRANEKAAEAIDQLNNHIDELESHVSGQWQKMSPEQRSKQQEVLAELRKHRAEAMFTAGPALAGSNDKGELDYQAVQDRMSQTIEDIQQYTAEQKQQAYDDMKQDAGEAWNNAVDAFENAYREARDEWKQLAS